MCAVTFWDGRPLSQQGTGGVPVCWYKPWRVWKDKHGQIGLAKVKFKSERKARFLPAAHYSAHIDSQLGGMPATRPPDPRYETPSWYAGSATQHPSAPGDLSIFRPTHVTLSFHCTTPVSHTPAWSPSSNSFCHVPTAQSHYKVRHHLAACTAQGRAPNHPKHPKQHQCPNRRESPDFLVGGALAAVTYDTSGVCRCRIRRRRSRMHELSVVPGLGCRGVARGGVCVSRGWLAIHPWLSYHTKGLDDTGGVSVGRHTSNPHTWGPFRTKGPWFLDSASHGTQEAGESNFPELGHIFCIYLTSPPPLPIIVPGIMGPCLWLLRGLVFYDTYRRRGGGPREVTCRNF